VVVAVVLMIIIVPVLLVLVAEVLVVLILEQAIPELPILAVAVAVVVRGQAQEAQVALAALVL
jgi:hypothetical protein